MPKILNYLRGVFYKNAREILLLISFLFLTIIVISLDKWSLGFHTDVDFEESGTLIEPLQNYDASFIAFGQESSSIQDVSAVYDILKNTGGVAINSDPLITSNQILSHEYYNPTLFTNGTDQFSNDSIESDIKYFNNVSHILMKHKLKGLWRPQET